MKKGFCILIVLLVFSFTVTTLIAQTTPEFIEFPIAVGEDSALTVSVAFDGTNYLVGIQGDSTPERFHASISAQLVSQSGTLVGSRISVGRTGGVPSVAFDGTSYLLVWDDDANNPYTRVYGQLINTSGNLVGSAFPISGGSALNQEVFGGITFGDSFYLVPWISNDTLFGQLVDKSGNLVGGEIQINSNPAHDWGAAIGFDGTNFLVAWTDNNSEDIYGQLISKSGVLVGSNFIIDDSPYFSANTVSISFDGSRYIVCFADSVVTSWDIFARFVTTSGTVAERVTIADGPGGQGFPFIDFDGTNYLITWMDDQSSIQSRGRFFNTSGVPVDTVFTIFDTLDNKFPLGAPVIFGDYQYLAVTSRLIVDTSGFTDGDVYGAFVPPCTGIEEKIENILEISEYKLQQNAPNPFRYQTDIRYQIVNDGFVNLSVYNVAGQKVKTLIDNYVSAGIHTCSWNGRDDIGEEVSSGVYFVKLKMENIELIREIMLVK